ncbi:MAG: cupin domain-containing protein [Candidatus Aenigmarchaeota archaeon]|nr:cupin domain-containing protein [Candidatus Aenigmarchaeota archaeon]
MIKELIKSEDTNKVANSEKCIAYEYPFGSEKTSLAVIDIEDRYPDSGSVLNRIFEEIILVLDGNGKIVIEGKEYVVKKDDAVLVRPNEKYHYEGNLKIAVFCAPAFKPENHEVIE